MINAIYETNDDSCADREILVKKVIEKGHVL